MVIVLMLYVMDRTVEKSLKWFVFTSLGLLPFLSQSAVMTIHSHCTNVMLKAISS